MNTITWLVLNDGTDEIFNIQIAKGNSQKELLYDMLMTFGTNTLFTAAELAESILSKSIYDASSWTATELENFFDKQCGLVIHTEVLPASKFRPITTILDPELVEDLQDLAEGQ